MVLATDGQLSVAVILHENFCNSPNQCIDIEAEVVFSDRSRNLASTFALAPQQGQGLNQTIRNVFRIDGK